MKVITAPNSYISSASSIANVGATPIFADVREDMNLDPNEVKRRINERTKAVIAVHLTGRPVDMDALRAVTKEHGLFLIEDAAQAIGVEYKGK